MNAILVVAGALFTEEALDYELSPVLEGKIEATDSLSGETSLAKVTVVLTDVNDIVPAFSQLSFDLAVLESSPVGSPVAVIQAKDNDTGKSLL